MKKSAPLYYLLPALLLLASCNDGPLGSFSEVEEYEFDGISGVYHVEGMRIITENRDWPIYSPDSTPDVDTTHVEFDMEIRLVDSKKDSARIFSYKDSVQPQSGYFPSEPVHLENGQISYDINSTGDIYKGKGAVSNDSLTMSVLFHYRGYTMEDELKGIKTEDRPSM